jgi:hypothetical protein
MATLANTIKKAEKISGQKIQKNDNNEFWIIYKEYTVSFYCNGKLDMINGEATCFYTSKSARTYEDVVQEYWPGCFHDNLSQCFKHIDRMTRNTSVAA